MFIHTYTHILTQNITKFIVKLYMYHTSCSAIMYIQAHLFLCRLKFPVIFVVYTCISQLVLLSSDLVAQVDRENVFCTSKNLLKNLEEVDTTFYCRFLGNNCLGILDYTSCSLIIDFCNNLYYSGAMFVYIRIQSILWWLFINGIMLYGVVRPLQYRSLSGSGRMKYVHFGCVAAAIGLPLISVLICHWFGGYGIAVPLNYACLPRNKWAVTYSLLLPLTVCGIIGLSMLLYIGSELTTKVYKICIWKK